MTVRPQPLTISQPSLRFGVARSLQTQPHCAICGRAVEINTSQDDAATNRMHEACYDLRQMLKQATIPTDRPRA